MSDPQLKVLLVEDNPGDARLIREMLAETGDSTFDLTVAGRLSAGLELLAASQPDVLLLDLSLPDSQGLESLARARLRSPAVPIIVLTGLDDEAAALKALSEGAQDYLVKGRVEGDLLGRALRYAIERQRLTLEVEQQRRRQMELKDEFLSHVSHELRSPLTAIYQFATLVLDGLAGKLNPQQREYLGIALHNVQQLRTMIEDILLATRAEVGKLQIEPRGVGLGDLVHHTLEALRIQAAEKNTAIETQISPDLPAVYADPKRARQVLTNLVENAIKYTPEGARILVRAEAAGKDPEFVQVAVIDNGPGLSPDQAARVFDRLYQAGGSDTASRKGLGLGLFISKQLVQAHGGRIWLETGPEKGSSFFFTLPVLSLAHLLEPILVAKRLKKGSLALITIGLAQDEAGLPPPARQKVLESVQDVLRHCIRPEMDLVLPNMRPAEPERMLFVTACTDRGGAELMAARISNQLAACDDLRATGTTPRVAFELVELRSHPEEAPVEQLVGEVAGRIQQLVEAHLREAEEVG